MPVAPLPNHLPPNTVAAPPGTKDGATRILSIADRRLDELSKGPRPVAPERKVAQRPAEKAGEDFDGWRPVAPRQDSTETATQPRAIDR